MNESALADRRRRRRERSLALDSQSSVPKIFCIGFHKTGTTSLTVALRELGYSVTGRQRLKSITRYEDLWPAAVKLTKKYQAFQDNPWPLFYRELDLLWPGSRFILTLRRSESWMRSQVQHFGLTDSRMRRWIYGVGHPQGNEAIYLRRYEEHNHEVLEYFKDRPQDLLVMTLEDGDGWEKLCPFLGAMPIPKPFPRANTAQERLQSQQA